MQEHWSGLPCPSPGHLPNPGVEPVFLVSPTLQADLSPIEPLGKPADGLYNQKMLSDHHHRGSKSVLEKKRTSRGTRSAVRGRTDGFEDSDALGTIEGKLGSTAALPPTSCDDPHKDMPLGIH